MKQTVKATMYKVMPYRIRKVMKLLKEFIPPKYRIKYRMGRQYWKYWKVKNFLYKTQWWDKERIEEWQFQKVRQIVKYAYENVPGYHQLYNEAGLKPDDIQTLEDIKLLPFVTKELLRDNVEDFSSKAIPKKMQRYATTGGSTGIPFGFYNTRENNAVENAFISTIWESIGFQIGEKTAVVRGAFVGTEKTLFDRTLGQLYDALLLSSYYLTDYTYPAYRGKLLKFKPSFLHVYPSAITILSDLMKAYGDEGKFDSVKAILTASENLYEWQNRKIQSAFPQARIFDFYGHSEKVILAAMCEYSEQYHIWPFYGVTEILNGQDEEVQEGKVGELVGTSFWNYATPFIRYRTMDSSKKGKFGCDKCGRHFQLLERIEGRLQEIIVSKRGRSISMTAINMHSDVFDNVKQFQFYQDTPGRVAFKIIRKNSYSESDTAKIRQELMKKLGEDMDLKIVFVDEIARTQRGKYRFLEQKLDIKYGE